ncbi:MAG: thioredoxin domain-containing protein [Deltaproteobacteria bacterium]|jgi:protein-disulfide isomerase
MHSWFKTTILCAAGALFACQNATPAKAPPKSGPSATIPKGAEDEGRLPGDTVVATWNGGKMTYAELLAQHPARFKAIRNKYQQDLYELEQQELEGQIIDMLIEQEAKKEGMKPEPWIEKIAGDAKPTDEDAKKFYEENLKDKGMQFELVRERILQVLEQQVKGERVRAKIEELKKNANVKMDLPAPKAAVAEFDLAGAPVKGPADAKVTIVEFSDFECPYCSRAVPGVEALLDKYKGKVRVAFLHFPLSFHQRAMPAAIASMCAHREGKFWEMHDKIFDNQGELTDAKFAEHAAAIGLDAGKFKACLGDAEIEKKIRADMEQAMTGGVQGTPSFFVNGVKTQGVPTVDAIEKALAGS